eukprot:evm.model.scf_128EXC.2 EVM.evm.TU.scf_128EXC.2   scf_128EXC:16519-19604(-)
MEDEDRPMFKFTNDVNFPNKVKLRKKFVLWPVVATLGADIDVRKPGFAPKFSLKDAILKGRFYLQPSRDAVGYRKTITAPFAGSVELNGEVHYRGELNPKWYLQYRWGGMCKMEVPNTLKLRQKIPLGETLGVEFRGHLHWPMPAAAFGQEGGRTTCKLGDYDAAEGAFQFTLDEANAYIKF